MQLSQRSHTCQRFTQRGVAARSRHLAAVPRATAGTMAPGTLTEEQVKLFHEQGYLVLPGFANQQEVDALRARVAQLIEGFDPAKHRSIFSTKNQQSTTDNYFFNSANDISFFLEEKAFDDSGELKQSKELSINKIGHAMHDLDPVFRSFSRSDKVSGVLKSLGYKRPLPVQSMYIFKQPRIGGEVVPHQDSSYIYTQPLSCTGLWWALEEATKDNGCLWAIPKEHKKGLRRRFFVNQEGKVQYDAPAPSYDMADFVPLECSAGTLVLLHGENVHYSAENTSPISRHSYSMHVVEGTSEHKWVADNWAHRPSNNPWEPFYE